jgi:DNA-binding Lrp family transcriptional regulator
MALPKFSSPVLTFEIPSTKTKFKFRPFLVKEEKLLLMAKASEEQTDILGAIKQVVNNCSLDDKFDVNALAIFDVEFLFLKLRGASIDNMIEVSYEDQEDKKVYDFEVELEKVKLVWPKKVPSNKIAVNKTSGLVLRYPPASLYDNEEFLASPEKEVMFELMAACITQIYDGDEVYEAKDYTHKELLDFVSDLDVKTFKAIEDFLQSAPKMDYLIEYKNSKGTDRQIRLTSLTDFFTLR